MQSVIQPAADLDNQPVDQPTTSEQTVTEPTTQPAVQAEECETGATVTQSAADRADQPVAQSVTQPLGLHSNKNWVTSPSVKQICVDWQSLSQVFENPKTILWPINNFNWGKEGDVLAQTGILCYF